MDLMNIHLIKGRIQLFLSLFGEQSSRPSASAKIRNTVNIKQVEVIGFLREQIIQYIEAYFSTSKKKADNLHSYLTQHHMCYLPIHAAMVCFLFDEMGNKLPRTETEMYKSFTNHTLLRALYRNAKHADISLESAEELPDQLFFQICKLAFEKTISSKQAMEHNEVKHFLSTIDSGKDSLGLITVDRMASMCGMQNLYTFLHLTFDDLFSVQCAFESQQTLPCDLVVQSGKDGCLKFG